MQELEENAYLERLGVEMIELRDCGECKVYYNSSIYFYEHNYQCRDILNTLGRLILKRKEG